MALVAQAFAVLAIVSTGVIYGTDAFAAIVLRPALRHLDDRGLVMTAGAIHRYGDRRLPLPGIVGAVGSLIATVAAGLVGNAAAATAAGVATLLLLVWVILYLRVAAPINKTLSRASADGTVPRDARELQERWDSIINVRALMQGAAVIGLSLALILL